MIHKFVMSGKNAAPAAMVAKESKRKIRFENNVIYVVENVRVCVSIENDKHFRWKLIMV